MIARSKWSSEFAFIAAAIGSAVGLGNIWKFPWMVSEYGGGLFIVAYLFCILVIGIPILIAEINLGYIGNANPVNAIANLAQGRRGGRAWSIIGYSGILAAFLIISFYMVICGWVCSYLFNIFSIVSTGDIEQAEHGFEQLTSNFTQQFFWHTLMAWSTIAIMSGSIRDTIEKVFSLIMPLLGTLLIALLIYSIFRGHAGESLAYMFHFDLNDLTGEIFIQAMGQAFFTLSLGMGAIMVFGSYLPKGSSVVRSAFIIGLTDTFVALSAAFIVFCLVFEMSDSLTAAGPGLVFKTLPIVFMQIPAGEIIGGIFFFALLLAAISSAMSLLEPLICFLTENTRFSRRIVALSVGLLIWLLGIPTILSFTDGFGLFGDSTWFASIDFLSSSILLPLGGILIAVFSSYILDQKIIRDALGLSPKYFQIYLWIVRTIAPLAVAITLINYLIDYFS